MSNLPVQPDWFWSTGCADLLAAQIRRPVALVAIQEDAPSPTPTPLQDSLEARVFEGGPNRWSEPQFLPSKPGLVLFGRINKSTSALSVSGSPRRQKHVKPHK